MGIKGGKRPGAGRKKGSRNKATQKRAEVALRALDAGVTPLDYMLDVMRRPIPDDAEPEVKVPMMGMRFEAAKAAAPYVHPRLAAIDVTTKEDQSASGLSNNELRELRALLLEVKSWVDAGIIGVDLLKRIMDYQPPQTVPEKSTT